MKQHFGVTIGSTLETKDIRDNRVFPYVNVLDLRQCENNGPRPIEETTLRRLANFRVRYEQKPMSLRNCNRRLENELFRMITDQVDNLLILSDEPAQVARFCRQLDIPFAIRDLYIIENASDYVPIQQNTRPKGTASFGSLAS